MKCISRFYKRYTHTHTYNNILPQKCKRLFLGYGLLPHCNKIPLARFDESESNKHFICQYIDM